MKDIDFTVSEVSAAYYRNYPAGYTFQAQGRPSFGLTLILSGELEMHINGECFKACAGDVILQRKGDVYKLFAKQKNGAEYIVISYMATPESALLEHLPKSPFKIPHFNRYKLAFENAERTFSSYSATSKTLLRAIVQGIICDLIADNYSSSLYSEKDPVDIAVKYIEENFSSPQTTLTVAQAAGISPSYLRALFQKSKGEAPIHYLNRIRIEHAKKMLSSGLFTLGEIACACGFQNEYYFNNVFKKFTGVTPGKY